MSNEELLVLEERIKKVGMRITAVRYLDTPFPTLSVKLKEGIDLKAAIEELRILGFYEIRFDCPEQDEVEIN